MTGHTGIRAVETGTILVVGSALVIGAGCHGKRRTSLE